MGIIMSAENQDDIRQKAMKMYSIFLKHYGEHSLKPPRRDPMTELIMTILSQRTTEANEALAFKQMWEHYRSWEAIRDADPDQLAELISPSTFPEPKAANIKATLTHVINERGQANIDFLQDLPVEEGLKWLQSLPGVGIKTASLVLLFNFGKQIMPVDTHVHRVSLRTGLLPTKTSANKAHKLLLDILANEPHTLFNFHVNCLRHGQKICIWSNPRCSRCPINHLCTYYRNVFTP